MSIVEIPPGSGNRYKYEYEDGKTVYKGPVGTAPELSEGEFLEMFQVVGQKEQKLRDRLLSETLSQNPDIEPELTAFNISEVADLATSRHVKEWQKIVMDYPIKAEDFVVFIPESPEPRWVRAKDTVPSFKNYYQAMDKVGFRPDDVNTFALSKTLGPIPEDYFPIRPHIATPGWQRQFNEKHDMKWDWRAYRDSINHSGKNLARFIHEHKLKRKSMFIVRKNSVEHDILRTASGILGYQLEVHPSTDPLWSKEGKEYMTDVMGRLKGDLN